MPRRTGIRAKLYGQVGDGGVFVPYELMTDAGDHKTYTGSQKPWSDTLLPDIRLNGLRSGGIVTPNTGVNDSIAYSAITAFVNSLAVTAVAGTVASLSKPATPGNILINSIVMDGSGAVAKLAGTEGAPGGAVGAAGGPPFVPVDKIKLADVVMASTTAAPVPAGQIDTDVAERADVPGQDTNYFDGGCTFGTPLPATHTGVITRKVWAQYRTAALAAIGNLKGFKLNVASTKTPTKAAGDDWQKDLSTTLGWKGSADGFESNPYWFDRTIKNKLFLVEFQYHENDQYAYQGLCWIDWGTDASVDSAVMEQLTFTGYGELRRIPAP